MTGGRGEYGSHSLPGRVLQRRQPYEKRAPEICRGTNLMSLAELLYMLEWDGFTRGQGKLSERNRQKNF